MGMNTVDSVTFHTWQNKANEGIMFLAYSMITFLLSDTRWRGVNTENPLNEQSIPNKKRISFEYILAFPLCFPGKCVLFHPWFFPDSWTVRDLRINFVLPMQNRISFIFLYFVIFNNSLGKFSIRHKWLTWYRVHLVPEWFYCIFFLTPAGFRLYSIFNGDIQTHWNTYIRASMYVIVT